MPITENVIFKSCTIEMSTLHYLIKIKSFIVVLS